MDEFKHFLDMVDRPAWLGQPSAIATRGLRETGEIPDVNC